jgi:hypothetical protein
VAVDSTVMVVEQGLVRIRIAIRVISGLKLKLRLIGLKGSFNLIDFCFLFLFEFLLIWCLLMVLCLGRYLFLLSFRCFF